jgi:hypothetical protein
VIEKEQEPAQKGDVGLAPLEKIYIINQQSLSDSRVFHKARRLADTM